MVVTKDTLVSSGAVLIIEPGTTVRFEIGISLYVDGSLQAIGRSDAPITLTAVRLPWGGVFVRPKATALFDTTIMSRAGAMGTALYAESASLTVRNTTLNSNIGQVVIVDGTTTIQQSVLRDNVLPYGAMVDMSVPNAGTLVIENSRIGPNSQVTGGSALAVVAPNMTSMLRMTLNGSIFTSISGSNLLINSVVPVDGAIQCNAFALGAIGVQIRSTLPQVPGIGIALRNNAFEGHSAEFSGARGATSDVAVDAQGNWWNSSTGPYDPKRYAAGKGEPVGSNVVADGWLSTRPACAPLP
ncbi:MAG: hypothetical protein LW717_08135 [Chloroflexaceae bacterium]|nr:hypothetical protein [Chloroflexaceae bacterium]